MHTQPRWTSHHHTILAFWQEAVSKVARHPWLLHQLVRQETNLLPRFSSYYRQLQTFPRRMRRALQGKLARSLAGIALLLALGPGQALANTIPVVLNETDIAPNMKCSLIEAMVNAIDDAATHSDCIAGSGADTIVLQNSSLHTLTSANNNTYGDTGLPVVSNGALTIMGNGSTIMRDSGAPAFRIFAIGKNCRVVGGGLVCDAPGSLTLEQITVSGGVAPSSQAAGGGVLNYVALTMIDSTLVGNTARTGGGIHNSEAGARSP